MLFWKKVLVWRQCIRFFRRMNFDLAEMVETGREKRINENKLGWVKIYTIVSSVQVKSCFVDVAFWSARWSHHLPSRENPDISMQLFNKNCFIFRHNTVVCNIGLSIRRHVGYLPCCAGAICHQVVCCLQYAWRMYHLRSFTAVIQSFEGKY